MKIIVFLSMFICTINAIPIAEKTKNIIPGKFSKVPLLATFQKDPGAFISTMEKMSKVDPAALSEILTMLRSLLATSESREQELDEDLQDKTNALDEANRAVGEAEEASRIANEEKAQADAHLQAEKSARNTKQTAKDNSESARAGEINTLDSEQEVLLNVISILENLLGQNTASPTSAPTPTEDTYSALRLVFTKNHGASAVCVDEFKIYLNGQEVSYPSQTTITDSGVWSGSYPGRHLRAGVGGYYCSEHGSCQGSVCDETVTFTMPEAIKFDSYSLQQDDGMAYNPRDFTLQGKAGESEWNVLSSVTNFDFSGRRATSTWPINE